MAGIRHPDAARTIHYLYGQPGLAYLSSAALVAAVAPGRDRESYRKLLRRMVATGCLDSSYGPQGGFRLAGSLRAAIGVARASQEGKGIRSPAD